MSLLKQIEDKGAVLEWSPVAHHANLVALGTKDSAGAGFDDHGGELEIHLLDFTDTKSSATKILGKARANSRFSSIAWSQMCINAAEFPFGLIAGGMADGNIHVWDPAKLAEGDQDALLASVEQHQGAIYGLHFNPHRESSHLLASGGSDGEVFVTSLEHPDQPSVFIPAPPPNNAKHTADVTKVAWNTQVAHILASSAQNGSCFIWDLRQKRAWCELRDPSGGCVADVAWNPDQGLHLVTASGDDKNPVLKLWDLRSSTSLPLATLQGHTEGILSVSWCPSDPSLLLSCGTDNRTILWDLFHLQPVYDLPSGDSGVEPGDPDQNAVFGKLATSAGHKRYHVSWSPCMPAVVSACSFDRRVQFFSMTGAKSSIGRAPKWLRKPVGAAFGFGGKLISFDSQNIPIGNQAKKATAGAAKVKISQVVEDFEFMSSSDIFHATIAKGEFKQFCEMKALSPRITEREKQVWSLMNVICFGANAREELLTHLGFDSQSITAATEQYGLLKKGVTDDSGLMAVDRLSSLNVQLSDEHSVETAVDSAELVKIALAGREAEPTIRKAIIVGNFEAAVNCCLDAGLMAEALLLAQCGDQALRVKTQAVFFERQRNKHPFLNVLHAVIKNELMVYVLSSDLRKWKETLALLSTYGKSDEFPALCEALAARLEMEESDKSSATLCYMCAANVERTLSFWTEELNIANSILGYMDTVALENYVEKVVVFTQANPVESLGIECSSFFAKYAELLANQGRLDVAISYLKGNSQEENILIDRLFHAGSKPVGLKPPPFPYSKVNVENYDAMKYVGKPVTTVESSKGLKASKVDAGASTVLRTMSKSASDDGRQSISSGNLALNNAIAQSREWDAASTNFAPAVAYTLPSGWIQLVDPASGHPYYVNQATGQSQWESPAPAPTVTLSPPTPISPDARQPVSVFSHSNSLTSPSGTGMAVSTSLAGGLGSASHSASNSNQEPSSLLLAAATANSGGIAKTEVAVHSETSQSVESEVVFLLGQIIESVGGSLATPAEKKQLTMVKTAYSHLVNIAKSHELAPEVMQKLSGLVDAISNRNITGATAIQTDLANTAWDKHKDWLKGTKVLIQLAAKK